MFFCKKLVTCEYDMYHCLLRCSGMQWSGHGCGRLGLYCNFPIFLLFFICSTDRLGPATFPATFPIRPFFLLSSLFRRLLLCFCNIHTFLSLANICNYILFCLCTSAFLPIRVTPERWRGGKTKWHQRHWRELWQGQQWIGETKWEQWVEWYW